LTRCPFGFTPAWAIFLLQVTTSFVALELAASLGGPQTTMRWLATTFYPCPADFLPEHLKMFSLSSDPSKPGTGATNLTGGSCRSQVLLRFAPDQSSTRRWPSSPVFDIGLFV
jgi:hypothetical protein